MVLRRGNNVIRTILKKIEKKAKNSIVIWEN
jgi:hypothetical protein